MSENAVKLSVMGIYGLTQPKIQRSWTWRGGLPSVPCPQGSSVSLFSECLLGWCRMGAGCSWRCILQGWLLWERPLFPWVFHPGNGTSLGHRLTSKPFGGVRRTELAWAAFSPPTVRFRSAPVTHVPQLHGRHGNPAKAWGLWLTNEDGVVDD